LIGRSAKGGLGVLGFGVYGGLGIGVANIMEEAKVP